MRPPLKLSAIDQEHLQELYDAAGVARDELPYSDVYEQMCVGFQDRTFKNAHQEQVYGAMLKYLRSGTCAASKTEEPQLAPEQIKTIKGVILRHGMGTKLLPYSDEFENALKEFNSLAGTTMNQREFWRALVQAQGGKRRPPPRRAKAPVEKSDEADAE